MKSQDEPWKILIADDHSIVRSGLRNLINTSDYLTVAGEAADGDEVVEFLNKNHVDLVTLDLSLPKVNGLQLIDLLKRRFPKVRILVLTMHQDVGYAQEAIATGLDGYVLKQAASTQLMEAIQEVLSGGRWLSPSLAFDLVGGASAIAPREDPFESITPRQRQILRGLLSGKVAKEIARSLSVSRKTVEYHKYRLMAQMGVTTSTELLRLAVQHGVTPDE